MKTNMMPKGHKHTKMKSERIFIYNIRRAPPQGLYEARRDREVNCIFSYLSAVGASIRGQWRSS